MPDHSITLMYQPNGNFAADPPSVAASPQQTIGFQLAAGSMDGKIRITFRERHFFSGRNPHFRNTGVLHDGDGEVTVAQPLTHRTTYHCELLDAGGNVIAQSRETGGDIVPSTRSDDQPQG